jgi:hypothetical protein
VRRRHGRFRNSPRAEAARWLVADARDVAIIDGSRPRQAAAVRTIASGIARWQGAIERRRRLAIVRRAAIVGLLSACLLELGAVASGRAGAGPWLLPAIVVALLCLTPGVAHRTTPSIAARMLDRDLRLGAGVTTALELEREAAAPSGLRSLAIADGRDALARSLVGARVRLQPGRRENGLLAALAVALVGCLLLPAASGRSHARGAGGARVTSRAATSSAESDPTRQHAGPDLRQFGQTQPTLPPLEATAGAARRTGATAATGRRENGSDGHTPGSVQASSRTVGNAGYLQTARTNSSKSPAGASEGAAGRGRSTLTSQQGPAASEVGSSAAVRATPAPDERSVNGNAGSNGIPGRANTAGGGTSRGGGSTAAGDSQTPSSRQATPGGATAGGTHGAANAALGVVPQLAGGKTLPIQPGYETAKGTKGGQGENASADANGAGGASHSGRAGAGAAIGSEARDVPYVAPGSSSVAPADRRLLRGYFGSFARVSAAGW